MVLSNSFDVTVSQADIYVSQGRAGGTQNGSYANPYATIAQGISALGAGQTLEIEAGTYVESISDNNMTGGTDANNYTVIRGAAGQTVIIEAPQTQYTNSIKLYRSTSDPWMRYVEFRNLECKGYYFGIHVAAGNIEYLRFVDVTTHNATQSGLLCATNNSEFIRCISYNNGDDRLDHGFYCAGDGNLFQDCQAWENAGNGIQAYEDGGRADNAIIERCITFNNGYNPVHNSTPDLYRGGILADGQNTIIRNCLSVGNPGPGIYNYGGGSNQKIYNNTCYGNDRYGIQVYGPPDGTSPTGGIVTNNICYGNGIAPIQDPSGVLTLTTNWIDTDGDPLFLNASTNRLTSDFHLDTGSGARNAGTNLYASGIVDDLEENPRPSSGAFDIGCYEHG